MEAAKNRAAKHVGAINLMKQVKLALGWRQIQISRDECAKQSSSSSSSGGDGGIIGVI